MILLEKVSMEMPGIVGLRKKISEEEVEKYNEAKKDFAERLGPLSSGKALVAEIYKLLDQLTFDYIKENAIACRAKCSYCCKQMVCCTTLEMELIADYLQALPRTKRRPIVRKARIKAMNFYEKNYAQINGASRWEELGEFLKSSLYLVPCIFLKDRKCTIYPVRPIDCRIAKTATSCGYEKNLSSKPRSIRLFCDQVASDMVMGEEERCYGSMQVVPLIGWPISKRFRDFFK